MVRYSSIYIQKIVVQSIRILKDKLCFYIFILKPSIPKTAFKYYDALNCVHNMLQNMTIQQYMSPKNQLYVKNIKKIFHAYYSLFRK